MILALHEARHLVVAIAENLLFDRKVDELDKAIAVASRDPDWYGIDTIELDKRRWTSTARSQVSSILYFTVFTVNLCIVELVSDSLNIALCY